jgi:hypothetical protein
MATALTSFLFPLSSFLFPLSSFLIFTFPANRSVNTKEQRTMAASKPANFAVTLGDPSKILEQIRIA